MLVSSDMLLWLSFCLLMDVYIAVYLPTQISGGMWGQTGAGKYAFRLVEDATYALAIRTRVRYIAGVEP